MRCFSLRLTFLTKSQRGRRRRFFSSSTPSWNRFRSNEELAARNKNDLSLFRGCWRHSYFFPDSVIWSPMDGFPIRTFLPGPCYATEKSWMNSIFRCPKRSTASISVEEKLYQSVPFLEKENGHFSPKEIPKLDDEIRTKPISGEPVAIFDSNPSRRGPEKDENRI